MLLSIGVIFEITSCLENMPGSSLRVNREFCNKVQASQADERGQREANCPNCLHLFSEVGRHHSTFVFNFFSVKYLIEHWVGNFSLFED